MYTVLLIPDAVLGCKEIKSLYKVDLSEDSQDITELEHDLDLSEVPRLSSMESRVNRRKANQHAGICEAKDDVVRLSGDPKAVSMPSKQMYTGLLVCLAAT